MPRPYLVDLQSQGISLIKSTKTRFYSFIQAWVCWFCHYLFGFPPGVLLKQHKDTRFRMPFCNKHHYCCRGVSNFRHSFQSEQMHQSSPHCGLTYKLQRKFKMLNTKQCFPGADRVASVREEIPKGAMPPLMSEMLEQEEEYDE